MATVVVGDLHGQIELASRAYDKAKEAGHEVIFIGDYLDSFNRSIEDQIDLLRMVLYWAEQAKVVALKGNHEMSYLNPRHRCSGYNGITQRHADDISSKMWANLKDYEFREGFLISHAGVSKKLLDKYEMSLTDYLLRNQFGDIGRARGGSSISGGLYWCDWYEEFEPVEDQPQIVGHSRGKAVRQKGNSYCIDCLEDSQPEALLIENGEAEIFNF